MTQRKYIFILVAIVLLFMASSCDKDQENVITGKWQLQLRELNGEEFRVDTQFYNFDLNVMQLQCVKKFPEEVESCFGIYKIKTDSLFLEILNFQMMEPEHVLQIFGWKNSYKNFKIIELNHSRLKLSDEGEIYTFRKF